MRRSKINQRLLEDMVIFGYDMNHTYKMIADHLGISVFKVGNILKKRGVQGTRPKKSTPKTEDQNHEHQN